MSRKWMAVFDRDWNRAQEIKTQLHLADRKKIRFTFRGLQYDVYRLNNEIVTIHDNRILKNPPKKLIEKVTLFFGNEDVHEIMDS
jgi:hypothetical protein